MKKFIAKYKNKLSILTLYYISYNYKVSCKQLITMSKFKIQLLSILLLPLMAMPQPVEEKPEIREPLHWENPAPTEVIERYAIEYGVDKNLLYSIIKCESHFNQNAVGLAGEVTMAQFLPTTFEGQAKKMGEQLDIKSYHDAIKLTAYSLSIGDGKLWTTYRAIQNGGTYTFTDRKGITHTSYCKYKQMVI